MDVNFPLSVNNLMLSLIQKGNFWIFGGAIRDVLIGRSIRDIDIMTTNIETLVDDSRFSLLNPNNPNWYVGKIDKFPLDITKPVTAPATTSLTKVLLNLDDTDLTVNSLAWRPDLGLDRSVGALEDLQAKILRKCSIHFKDYYRFQYRTLRFSAELDWDIEPDTWRTIQQNFRTLALNVPVWYFDPDMRKVLIKGVNPGKLFELLDSLDALSYIYPLTEPIVKSAEWPVIKESLKTMTPTQRAKKLRIYELGNRKSITYGSIPTPTNQILTPTNQTT